MTDEKCALCGKPATGYAFIMDARFCHGDDDPSPTCYERASIGVLHESSPGALNRVLDYITNLAAVSSDTPQETPDHD